MPPCCPTRYSGQALRCPPLFPMEPDALTHGDDKPLTDNERRLARILAIEPDALLWRAAWLSGYGGGAPGLPEPGDTKVRRNLGKSAKRAADRPRVQAEIARIQGLTARSTRARAAAGDPEAKAEMAYQDRRRDAITAEVDVLDLAERLLALKVGGALSDIADFMEWEAYDGGMVRLKGSADLTLAERQLIQRVSFHPRCGSCGADHVHAGVTVELVPKAVFAAQASKQLGLDAPRKVEVTGRDGGALVVPEGQGGLSAETIEAVRRAIIGSPVPLPET